VVPNLRYGEWANVENSFTTQVPAVVCCGLQGKIKAAWVLFSTVRLSSRAGRFRRVFGSKNLKAISVIGTGSVPIANPKAFMEARLWFRQFLYDVNDPRRKDMVGGMFFWIDGSPAGANVTNNPYFGTNSLPLYLRVPQRARPAPERAASAWPAPTAMNRSVQALRLSGSRAPA